MTKKERLELRLNVSEIRDRIMTHEGPDIRNEVLEICEVLSWIIGALPVEEGK